MDNYLWLASAALVAYLVGAIPFGYLIGRWRGVDVFQQGSGNIGATNVGRLLGWRFGILVFLLDFGKGALPTTAGLAVGSWRGIEPVTALGVTAGLAALLGHIFPVYLRFRGGKGVATGAGVVAVLLPLPTLAGLAAWVLVATVSRIVSLASLMAAVVLCAAYLAQTPGPLGPEKLILTLFCLAAVGLVFVKHRANIGRLIHGTENRLPDTGSMRLFTKIVHVFAVGLWFGTAVFFSFVVALTLFGTFEELAQKSERPSWFPLPAEYRGMEKEQGIRAAGYAVGPLFANYFLLQGLCGLFATVTALGWSRAEPGRRVHRIRVLVLLFALATVLAGWPLERKVSELRQARDDAGDRLRAASQRQPAATQSDVEGLRAEEQTVRREFGSWHTWSVLLNLVTVALVTVAMALTAALPIHRIEHSATPRAVD